MTELSFYLARRLALGGGPSFSRFIIRVAVGAVTLSVAVMILAGAIVRGFQREVSGKVFGFWGHLLIKTYQDDVVAGEAPISIRQPFYPNLSAVPGIEHIQVYATKAGIIKTDEEIEGIILKGVGRDFRPDFMQSSLLEGSLIHPSDSLAERKIVISAVTASRLKLKVGDPVLIFFVQEPMRFRRLTVSGIYKTGLEEYDRIYALVDLRLIQRLNNWSEDEVGGFEVFVSDTRRLQALTELVNDQYLGAKLQAFSLRDINPNLFDWLDLQNMNERVIIVLMLLVAVINIVTVLLILILERANMIGILKALGASDWTIRKIFIYHAIYVALVGMLFGNGLGLTLALVQKHFKIITLNEESYYVSVAPISLEPWYILALNAGTLLVCLVTLLLPSYLVTRISPIQVIRFG
ncbi:MAG: FtsX-like permease family protein [Chitinophagales bacterium]|nr:FtsX-like permease family protein [Chitinophagales bacterium]MDW8428798.1 FtsX-like permease family protein [Chitinophagales bacterium]